MMQCVTTVRFVVNFDGKLPNYFSPTRGLRQGDPLSPFLFLFVAEGLSRALEAECAAGKITPLKVARGSPGISIFYSQMIAFSSLKLIVMKQGVSRMPSTNFSTGRANC